MAAIGLYSVIAFGVSQRTREMGVRMALGAQPRDVVQMVLRQGLAITFVGTIAGVVLALAATRGLRDLLWGVAPGDPLTLVAVVALLTLVATAASYVPARRAAAVDPMEALRAE